MGRKVTLAIADCLWQPLPALDVLVYVAMPHVQALATRTEGCSSCQEPCEEGRKVFVLGQSLGHGYGDMMHVAIHTLEA